MWRLLALAGTVVAIDSPASARITQTRETPSESWSPLLPLTLGGGFEFETNRERSAYNFPLLLEYNFSEWFKLSIEPNFLYIDGKAEDVRTVGGFGDLETSVEYEFIRERRYTPALTALATVKWPTASDPDLGNPGYDYSVGLILSKDLVTVDLDFSVIYNFSGDPEQQDTLELTLAAEYPLNSKFDLIGEIDAKIPTGHGGSAGGSSATDIEGTLGFAWHVNEQLKFEQGFVLRNDGTWQVVFAWEFSFSGD